MSAENKKLPAVRAFGMTDRGKVRPGNEDHFLIAEMARTMWVHGTSLPEPHIRHGSHHAHVFVVADGMGGHQAGEVASAVTVRSLEIFLLDVMHRFSNLRDFEEQDVRRDLEEALQHIKTKIRAVSAGDAALKGMGTTLTMAFASDWNLFIVHVGDSRCYLFRSGQIQQLTSDHTFVAELVRRGHVRPENVAHHAYRHVITNAIGGNFTELTVEARRLDLLPQDALLVCSDGLTDMLSDDRIKTILQAEREPKQACEHLVSEANSEGGRDNITAIVARFDEAA
jgi:protein phosphatase